jgi:hypothetical protein
MTGKYERSSNDLCEFPGSSCAAWFRHILRTKRQENDCFPDVLGVGPSLSDEAFVTVEKGCSLKSRRTLTAWIGAASAQKMVGLKSATVRTSGVANRPHRDGTRPGVGTAPRPASPEIEAAEAHGSRKSHGTLSYIDLL